MFGGFNAGRVVLLPLPALILGMGPHTVAKRKLGADVTENALTS